MNNFIMSETESRFEGLAGTPLPKKNFPSVPAPPPPGGGGGYLPKGRIGACFKSIWVREVCAPAKEKIPRFQNGRGL